jgi:hypothetical protein
VARLRLRQLAQDGAANGQVLTFDTSLGTWKPGGGSNTPASQTGQFSRASSGTNIPTTSGAFALVSWTTASSTTTGSVTLPAGNPSRMTVGVAGTYLLQGQISFLPSTAGSARLTRWVKNGAGSASGGTALLEIAVAPLGGGNATYVNVSQPLFLNAGDYVEIFGLQDSGGSLGIYHQAALTYANLVKVD